MAISHSGANRVVANLKRIQDAFPKQVARAVYKRGQGVMTRSKREFVPVAKKQGGVLLASGHVQSPEINGRNISVTLSFGGAADAYAIAVHEHLSEHSPPSWQKAEESGDGVHFHPEGRGPKFLETPLMEAVSTMAVDIAEDLKGQIK
jgi:hypothetical protein